MVSTYPWLLFLAIGLGFSLLLATSDGERTYVGFKLELVSFDPPWSLGELDLSVNGKFYNK